jgi:hypothetical protein
LWRRHAPRVAWRTVAAAVAGAAAMLGLFCLDVARSDYGSELAVVLSRNFHYGALDRAPFGASLSKAAITLARILLGNPIALLFLAMTLVGWWYAARTMPRPQKVWLAAASLWLAAAVVGAWPGGRHYAHYYHLIWPGLGVLGAFWLSRGWDFAFARRVQRTLCLGVVAGSIAVAGLQQTYSAAKAARDFDAGKHPRTFVEQAARFLDETTSPTTPVVVQAWFDRAELYWRAPRPAPSYSMPRVLPGDLFDEWAAATLAHPPEVIVWDGTPFEPIEGRAEEGLASRIESLVRREYRAVRTFGDLTIYRHQGASERK